MARHLSRIAMTCMILALAPIDADAASVKKRMAVMEKKLQQLSRSVSALKSANKKLRGRLANVERALTYQTVASFNRSAVLTPSTLHPNDRTVKFALPNAQSPFEGYLWLAVSVTYQQMSG
ncbi:MAG TPA: hypothetical protein VMP03_00790, partial [Methylomirabilota bacterium]|nr:hypothetical protein [Methylomirabilota bacterium]